MSIPASDRQELVYVYRRTRDGAPVYVGRGDHRRALDEHADNPRLARLIRRGDVTTEIMPVPDRATAKTVEAALISVLATGPHGAALTNRAAGHGPGFGPLGVPVEAAGRFPMPALTLADLGRITGGCLVVRTGESALGDGRRPIDPAHIVDSDVAAATVGVWQIPDTIVQQWIDDDAAPRIILGASGPLSQRYSPAAAAIDTGNLPATLGATLKTIPVLGATPAGPTTVAADLAGVDLDAHQLRGRRLDPGIRFGSTPAGFWMWVTADGKIAAGGRR